MVILRIGHRFDFKDRADELQARLLVFGDEFLDVGPNTDRGESRMSSGYDFQ